MHMTIHLLVVNYVNCLSNFTSSKNKVRRGVVSCTLSHNNSNTNGSLRINKGVMRSSAIFKESATVGHRYSIKYNNIYGWLVRRY